MPNSITIYKNNTKNIITKDNSKFTEILKLTDTRFGENVNSYKCVQTKEEVDKTIGIFESNWNIYVSPIGELQSPDELINLLNK